MQGLCNAKKQNCALKMKPIYNTFLVQLLVKLENEKFILKQWLFTTKYVYFMLQKNVHYSRLQWPSALGQH